MNEYLAKFYLTSTVNVAYYRISGSSGKKFSDMTVETRGTSEKFPHGTVIFSLPVQESECDKIVEAIFDLAESHGFILAPTMEMVNFYVGELVLNGGPFTEEELVEAVKVVEKMI